MSGKVRFRPGHFFFLLRPGKVARKDIDNVYSLNTTVERVIIIFIINNSNSYEPLLFHPKCMDLILINIITGISKGLIVFFSFSQALTSTASGSTVAQ